MTDLTTEEIIAEMESGLDLLPPLLPGDISIWQLMDRWNCAWSTAKRRGEQLANTGKLRWVRVRNDQGGGILVLRKSVNGKTKKR